MQDPVYQKAFMLQNMFLFFYSKAQQQSQQN